MSDIHSFEPLWNQWLVVKPIGTGSLSTVWLVKRFDEFSRQTQYAAVKHLSIPIRSGEVDELPPDQRQTIFQQQQREVMTEINALATLKGSPRIVAYEDHHVRPKADRPGFDIFLRTEVLCPLKDYIDQCRGLNLRQLLYLGLHMAEAIDALENRKLIHRDIRPANIFVDQDGEFKLGDFAMARMVEQGQLARTPAGFTAYMAPEMYAGMPYDHTVDIYSLGIVLYTYLNGGRLPFQESGMPQEQAIKLRIANRQPMPAPQYAPADLAPIILKACAYRPSDRYQTAQELIRDLKQIIYRHRTELDSLPPSPRPVLRILEEKPPAPVEDTDRKARKKKLLLAGAVVLVMAALITAVVILGTAG